MVVTEQQIRGAIGNPKVFVVLQTGEVGYLRSGRTFGPKRVWFYSFERGVDREIAFSSIGYVGQEIQTYRRDTSSQGQTVQAPQYSPTRIGAQEWRQGRLFTYTQSGWKETRGVESPGLTSGEATVRIQQDQFWGVRAPETTTTVVPQTQVRTVRTPTTSVQTDVATQVQQQRGSGLFDITTGIYEPAPRTVTSGYEWLLPSGLTFQERIRETQYKSNVPRNIGEVGIPAVAVDIGKGLFLGAAGMGSSIVELGKRSPYYAANPGVFVEEQIEAASDLPGRYLQLSATPGGVGYIGGEVAVMYAQQRAIGSLGKRLQTFVSPKFTYSIGIGERNIQVLPDTTFIGREALTVNVLKQPSILNRLGDRLLSRPPAEPTLARTYNVFTELRVGPDSVGLGKQVVVDPTKGIIGQRAVSTFGITERAFQTTDLNINIRGFTGQGRGLVTSLGKNNRFFIEGVSGSRGVAVTTVEPIFSTPELEFRPLKYRTSSITQKSLSISGTGPDTYVPVYTFKEIPPVRWFGPRSGTTPFDFGSFAQGPETGPTLLDTPAPRGGVPQSPTLSGISGLRISSDILGREPGGFIPEPEVFRAPSPRAFTLTRGPTLYAPGTAVDFDIQVPGPRAGNRTFFDISERLGPQSLSFTFIGSRTFTGVSNRIQQRTRIDTSARDFLNIRDIPTENLDIGPRSIVGVDLGLTPRSRVGTRRMFQQRTRTPPAGFDLDIPDVPVPPTTTRDFFLTPVLSETRFGFAGPSGKRRAKQPTFYTPSLTGIYFDIGTPEPPSGIGGFFTGGEIRPFVRQRGGKMPRKKGRRKKKR